MRVLLAHNSLYYPSFGGGDKSNRLLMEALAARGHEVQVMARAERFGSEVHDQLRSDLDSRGVPHREEEGAIRFHLNGVHITVLTRNSMLRAYFTKVVRGFDPDVILTSTDDPAHLLFETALRAPRARVVYMVRAIIALPFGPDSSMPSAAKSETLKQADGVVAVSHAVAGYARQWGDLDAVHVPISLLDSGDVAAVGRFENRFVTMVNPCAAKGITIFTALAALFPFVEFAAVPTWGTTAADIGQLEKFPNISVLPPVDDIHALLEQTRVVLVPSLWAEARSRIILEAMVRGIPVMSSDVGGLPEAMLGVDYLLPVNPIVRYESNLDELMVPIAEVPDQDIGPWESVLRKLVTDREHYQELSSRAQSAAMAYASKLNVLPFEAYLDSVVRSPRRRRERVSAGAGLSPERQRLLALRLKRRARDTERASE